MDIAAVSDVRTGYSIDFIKSTADPVRYAVAPPNTHNNSAFIKKIDYSMNFPIGQDSFDPGSELVPTQSGLVLQFPLLGASSIWHFGIVPGNTTTQNQPENAGSTHGLSSKLAYFRFDYPLAIPYVALQNDQIRIAPDLSTDFSITRMFASIMTLSSPTVPVSGVAFNGQLAIGCVHDTRDIAQVLSGNEVNVYSPTDLSQQSVTSKDGIRDVKSEDGVVGIQGSEIDTQYTAPNQSRVDLEHGEWAQFNIMGQGMGVQSDGGNVNGDTYCFSSMWISPWQTTCETFVALSQGTQLQRVITEAIGESDVLDIDIRNVTIRNNHCGNLSNLRSWVFAATAVHVFATCDSNGNVNYSNFQEVKTVEINSDYCAALYNGGAPPGTYGVGINEGHANIACNLGCVSFRPKRFQESMTTTGKYIGTSIIITLSSVGGEEVSLPGQPSPLTYWIDHDGKGASFPGGASSLPNTTGNKCTVYVKPHSLYVRGVIGPCKVYRWDGQSPQSVMRLEGISRVQCIPQGSIAPYVQGAAMNAPNAVDMNALCIVSELYNGNTSFQRSWRAPDYYRWIREVIPNLDATNLYRDTKESTKALASLEAGGIFDALGQGLAGLGMGVGRALGGLMSAGQFGIGGQQPLEAAGQFGMMNAGGNFGGLRRNRLD